MSAIPKPAHIKTLFQSQTIGHYKTVTDTDLKIIAVAPALLQDALAQNIVSQQDLKTLSIRLNTLYLSATNRTCLTIFFDWVCGRSIKIKFLKAILSAAIPAIVKESNAIPPAPLAPGKQIYPIPSPVGQPVSPPNNNPGLVPGPFVVPVKPPVVNPSEPIGIDEQTRRSRKFYQLNYLIELAKKELESPQRDRLQQFLEERVKEIWDPVNGRNPPLPIFTLPTDDVNGLQATIETCSIAPAPGSCRFGALTLDQPLPKGKHQIVVSMDAFAGQLAHTFDSNGPCIACNTEEIVITGEFAACFVSDDPKTLNPKFIQTLQSIPIPTLDTQTFHLFRQLIVKAVKDGKIQGPQLIGSKQILGNKAALLQRVRHVFNAITDQQLQQFFPHLTTYGGVDTTKKVCRTIAEARYFTKQLFDDMEKTLAAGGDPAFPMWTHSSRHWKLIIQTKLIKNSTGGAAGPGVYFSDWDEEGTYGDTTFAVDEGALSTTKAKVFNGGAGRDRFPHETLNHPPTWIAVDHKAGGVYINERSVAYVAINDQTSYPKGDNTAHANAVAQELYNAGFKIKVVSRTVSRIFQYCIHKQQADLGQKRLLPKGWVARYSGSIPNHVKLE